MDEDHNSNPEPHPGQNQENLIQSIPESSLTNQQQSSKIDKNPSQNSLSKNSHTGSSRRSGDISIHSSMFSDLECTSQTQSNLEKKSQWKKTKNSIYPKKP